MHVAIQPIGMLPPFSTVNKMILSVIAAVTLVASSVATADLPARSLMLASGIGITIYLILLSDRESRHAVEMLRREMQAEFEKVRKEIDSLKEQKGKDTK